MNIIADKYIYIWISGMLFIKNVKWDVQLDGCWNIFYKPMKSEYDTSILALNLKNNPEVSGSSHTLSQPHIILNLPRSFPCGLLFES